MSSAARLPGGEAGASRPDASEVDDVLLRGWALPAAEEDGDKESRGRVLVVAGSRELPGAAVLAATAALRAGAGKLVVATPESAWALVAAALPEARVIPLPETTLGGPRAGSVQALASCADQTAALLVGPGMADGIATCAFVQDLLAVFRESVIVLDALAMDCVRNGTRFDQPVLMTPHAGEMAHLTGAAKEDIRDRPHEVAAAQARAWNATVALKGATTCIAAPDGRNWRHQASTPGLGTSGSGDVLAGVVAGLAARGASPEQAAVWGVALHARAGAALATRQGALGFLARDLAAEVPTLMHALSSAS